MATILNRTTTFATNGTVTAAGLHNLIDDTAIYAGLITTQTELTTVGTADQILIAVGGVSDTGTPRRATVQNLFDDALTAGTFVNLNLTGALTYGTAAGTRLVSSNATITTGTITTGVIPTLTAGTTISTAANITNGTVQTLTASTASITTGTVATLNSTTGTITNLISTTGTVATLNSTTGTITGLNTTTGTITTLNSTTGTIGNLSTTLAGDFTISQGTGTIGTAKVTPTNLSQPFTSATAVASTSGTAIDFTGIPSWVKRITVSISGVSTNGASNLRFRIGPVAGVETSGYLGATTGFGTTTLSSVQFTDGFDLNDGASSGATRNGVFIISLLNSSTNLWSFAGTMGQSNSVNTCLVGGSKPLAGVLSVVRMTTVNGTDTFDAGNINIMYEG